MRTVIQGKELTITLKAERELTTQEIVMAHQLATGNFEALFVNDDQEQDIQEAVIEEQVEVRSFKGDTFIEKGTPVKSEVRCCFCGHCSKVDTFWGYSFVRCPGCKEMLFNSWATGVVGEENAWGCVYVAETPLKKKDEKVLFEEVFSDGGVTND